MLPNEATEEKRGGQAITGRICVSGSARCFSSKPSWDWGLPKTNARRRWKLLIAEPKHAQFSWFCLRRLCRWIKKQQGVDQSLNPHAAAVRSRPTRSHFLSDHKKPPSTLS